MKVRLFGLDAPEKAQSCADAAGKAYDCGELTFQTRFLWRFPLLEQSPVGGSAGVPPDYMCVCWRLTFAFAKCDLHSPNNPKRNTPSAPSTGPPGAPYPGAARCELEVMVRLNMLNCAIYAD